MPLHHQLHAIKIFALLLIGCGVAISLTAEPANYLMDVRTSDNDLPDSSVSSIAQTPDGYLWIGTYNGLARFDGARFVTFDPVTTPQLKNARISELFVDAWGTLWINTYDGSMTSYRNGVFTHEWQGSAVQSVLSTSNKLFFAMGGHHSRLIYREESGSGHGEWKELMLAGSATGNSIRQDGTGTIWYTIGTSLLYRINGTNSEKMDGWRGQSVKVTATDPEGNFWIGTDEAIERWNHDHFEDWTPTNGPVNINVSSLYCTTNGCWVFADGKVRKCSNRQWMAELDAAAWRDLTGAFNLDLNAYEDREGGLWFAHLGSGLFHIGADGQTEHLSTDNGLPSNIAACCFQDREGSFWVGLTHGGLVHLRKRAFQVVEGGLEGRAVSSICEDGQSNVWIGTFSGGLYRWRDEKLTRFDLPSGPYKECFFSIYPDSQNRLWASAGREDLYLMENDQIVQPSGTVHGLKAIVVDKQQRVWLGKQNGIAFLFNGNLRNFPSTNRLLNIRALAEDPAGGIWIGTGDGYLFHGETNAFIRYSVSDEQEKRPLLSLLPQNDGTLWIGTFRGGLLRFKNGKFTRYTTQDGLPSDIISQLLDDHRGRFWIGSQKGIFSISKNAFDEFDQGQIKTLPCISYGLSDGLPALECSGNYQPTCWRDHTGKLWFATVKGPVSIAPRDLSINHIAPPVVIEEVLVNGKPQLPAPVAGHFVVQPGERQLDFHFTALSFVAPDKVAFRYKLNNFDEDWIDGGTKRSARYGALAPGKYSFHVIACNNDGVWNQVGSTIAFTVRPFFWQTLWFQIGAIVIFMAAVLGTVRLVITRKLQRKLERLQQQEALQRERERIARDIHDDLGSGLTSIMLKSALAQRSANQETQTNLAQISSTAFELVGAMDEIVWAIDPENDTLDAVVTYTGKYVQEFVAQTGLRCRLDLPPQLPLMTISSQERHNLFLAVKEVLNNALKHAQATEISFSLKLQPSSFSFIIKDNGRGFVPSAVTAAPEPPADGRISSGHGLRNLAERMKKIGGTCAIRSEPGKGTEVELTLATQQKNVSLPDYGER